ncbi:MAG: 6-hydroxymethylpterin diphosphokinase MptE-like protein [Chlamydiota bacterium]
MQSNLGLMMERFPEIGFLLSHVPFEPFSLFREIDEKLNAQRQDFILHPEEIGELEDLEKIDIVYIFGLGLGFHYDALLEWLNAKPGRCLVFLEEDLGVIDAFLQRQEAATILHDERVHFRLILEETMWDEMIENLAQEFVSDKIACIMLPSYTKNYGERFKEIELKLMRATAAIHAIFSESLHSQKIFANLYPNFQLLPSAFFANKLENQFPKVPAIICGAGPSLKTAIPILSEMENQALIIAGGSTITALSRQGIEPHLGIALDPNSEEYERLRPSQAFEIPFLYANRVFPDVFATCNGPCGYLRSDTGGLTERWIEEKLGIEGEAIGPDLGREAFSVTTLAIALAYAMGCDPIILVGVDLAYTGMQRYADGVLETANDVSLDAAQADKRLTEQLLTRTDRKGNTVYTMLKWVMESSCISSYARAHPERTFINATDGGIGFTHVPYLPLEEAVREKCTAHFNLRGKIHSLIQQNALSHIRPESVQALFAELKTSLQRTLQLAEEIPQEKTGRRAVLEMDFVDEMAFECFLQPLGPALDRILNRYFAPKERESVKWKEIHSVITQYLDILDD